jgi:type VI secretion system secreted protein Hcp
MLAPAALTALVSLVPQGALAQRASSGPPFLIPFKDVIGTISIEGVDGGAPIHLLAIDFKVTTQGSIGSQTGGAGAGRATFNNFTVTKAIDASSPVLFQASVQGKHFANAILTLSNSSMTMHLSEVFVSSVEVKNDGIGAPTVELVGFEFAEIRISSPRESSGTPTPVNWNIVSNVAN